MRIIGGKWRRRNLVFQGKVTRPLTDKAREALFNVLENTFLLEGTRVLDGFAGSGAVGLEFLSRGAAWVDWVEIDPTALNHLRTLRLQWQLASCSAIHAEKVEKFLEKISSPYDFMFLGPPYRYLHKAQLITTVCKRKLFQRCCILEHPVYESYKTLPGWWQTKVYGTSGLSFYLPSSG
ncbi:MAG: RsmD family RNA methyltransferase [Bacteroidia bacterium]